MSAALPPCPAPARCPVAVREFAEICAGTAASALAATVVPQARAWHRVYDARDGYPTANPGVGNTRFAPFPSGRDGAPVPTMYVAETLEAALLETAFHNLASPKPGREDRVRLVTARDLLGRLHAQVEAPRDLVLADLRDPQLDRLLIGRDEMVSSSAMHYPCTRRVAQLIHAAGAGGASFDGIVWHSRQAELTGAADQEVAVVFCDRIGHGRLAGWALAASPASNGSLLEGAGLRELTRVADRLGVTLELDW